MNSMLIIALHDLRTTLRDRSAVMWMFILPVVFAAFFGVVFGGGGGSEPVDGTVTLSVLDLDASPASTRLIQGLEDERLSLTMRDPSGPKPEETIRTLVIPEGFARDLEQGVRTTLRLEKEPETSAEAAVVAQARIIRSAARLIGQSIVDEFTPEGADQATEPEPAVRVETTWAGQAQRPPSGFSLSIPGNATMFVLLTTLTFGAASVSSERRSGLLRRLATTPVTPKEIVMGKIAGRFAVSALQISVLVGMIGLARGLLGLDLGGNLVEIWGVLILFGLAVAPLGVAIGSWVRDPDRAANLGVMATMAMAAFGGCWWPLEVASDALQRFAWVFPTTWAMKALHGLISFGHPAAAVAPFLGMVLLFGLAFAALAFRSLRIS